MAGDKANDSAHMRLAASKLTDRLNHLETIRSQTKAQIDLSAQHFRADSANQYHEIMYEWDRHFDDVTQALGKVCRALGGTANIIDHAEEDRKQWSKTLGHQIGSLNLKI